MSQIAHVLTDFLITYEEIQAALKALLIGHVGKVFPE